MSYHYWDEKVWKEEFIPFLYDPDGQCQRNRRMKRYWDLLERLSIKIRCRVEPIKCLEGIKPRPLQNEPTDDRLDLV